MPRKYTYTEPGKAREFFEYALSYDGDDCLIWPFYRDDYGYARFDSKMAHTQICEIIYGPKPAPNYDAAHKCQKGHLGCINPKHLHWLIHNENVREGITETTKYLHKITLTGIVRSEETKKRISDAKTDPPQETRDRNRDATARCWEDPDWRANQIAVRKNMRYITNGVVNKWIRVGDPIPDGWRPGLTVKTERKRGYIRITNGIKNTTINPDESIPDGWWRGATQNRKK
jgi:hypothetical protein